MDEIKKLSSSERTNIVEQNWARSRAGLAPLTVRVRKCRVCGTMFETVAERTCSDCKRIVERSAVASLQGFEVI